MSENLVLNRERRFRQALSKKRMYENTDQHKLNGRKSHPALEYLSGVHLLEFSHNEPSTYDKTITTTNPASHDTYPDWYLCSVLNGRSSVGFRSEGRIP